jgi:hypothetical protein
MADRVCLGVPLQMFVNRARKFLPEPVHLVHTPDAGDTFCIRREP